MDKLNRTLDEQMQKSMVLAREQGKAIEKVQKKLAPYQGSQTDAD